MNTLNELWETLAACLSLLLRLDEMSRGGVDTETIAGSSRMFARKLPSFLGASGDYGEAEVE